jgi:PAS domain S-box-containing protein
MVKSGKYRMCVVFFFTLFLTLFSGCEKPSQDQPDLVIVKSFRDVQGITADEISAIEALQRKGGSFVYGMSPSTEAFIGNDGEIHGYSALFCNWMADMFGMPFKVRFYEWDDLLSGLESGEIDFTGELMTTVERRKTYFMTSPIEERSLKVYRIRGGEPLENILKSRPPKYAFLTGSVLSADVTENAGYYFETIFIDSYNTAYRMLRSGEIDAYFGMDTSEAAFDAFDNVITEDFYPLIFKSVCVSTRKAELQPIISAMEKMLDDQTLDYLNELYQAGYNQYLGNKLYNLLTEEERSYIQNNPVIPVAVEFSNYPVCFLDTYTNQWNGMYFDVLQRITKLTGLTFERVNDENTKSQDMIAMLERGEVLIIPELFRIEEYEDRFLWSEIPLIKDDFAFLSKSDFPNIEFSQIPHLKVAVRRDTIYSEKFKKMFPYHKHLVEFDTQEEVWSALQRDDVEVIFACQRRLIIYTNFYEDAGFKLNLILNYSFDSSFGYNRDAVVFKSIMDKALRIVNINNISNQWMHKAYDYRHKMAEAERPWLTGVIILFFFVLLLVSMFLIRSRNTGRRLETLVRERTGELSYKTSQLQMMIDSIPDLIFCKDTNLRYTQCNKHFEDFIGVSEADLLGKADADGAWLSSESKENIFDVEKSLLNEKRTAKFEEYVSSPITGKGNFFETVKAPLIQDGVVVGMMGIARDITKRKNMEKEIVYQTTLLKTIIDSLPDAVFIKDLNLKYTLCNKYMSDVFGRKLEDVVGKDDETALGMSAESAALANNFDRRVINKHMKVMFEENFLCADGVERLFETVKVPLVMDGEIIGILGIGRDITQRKEIEKELAFKTSQLQMVIDSITEVMFCKDVNLRYTQCNKYFEVFHGVREANILGLNDSESELFTPEDIEKINAMERVVIDEDRVFTLEETITSPLTGKKTVFETVKSPIKHNGAVVGLIAIIRDITQRKAMEEEIKAASRAKTDFLANMSHEIRTPLNVIIGLTDLVLEDERLDKYVSENLIKISNAGSTLLSIVNDILDFSKIESGKLELTPVEYYMASLLNDVVTLTVTRLGEKPVKFHLNIDDDLPVKLLGDDLRVKQIFTNLLTNSVKYTHQGSVELKVRCTREGDAMWMDIAVSDTGIGIREEDLKKLFSDYNQVDTKANRNIEGTGLGLAITKRLAEMMSGEIRVESEYGKGTTFHLRLKQGYVSDKPIGSELAEKLRSFHYTDDKRIVTKKLVRLNLSYAKVLVVDDMQTNLDVAAGLLRKYKMQVDCLGGGQEAIERIREGSPVYNAIFMDHMMPGMDGIEAVDAIRKLDTEYAQKIPVIALTANAIQGTEQMFYEHGFQAFISKPIDVMEMDSVIRKWVRSELQEAALASAAQVSGDVSSEVDVFLEGEDMVIEIPGVNTKKALSLYAGETDIYLPLLRSYVSNTRGILNKLRTVSAETLPEYVITVHGLKGTSAGVGAEGLREAALKLETMSRAGDINGVLAHNDRLIKDAEIVVGNIKAWLDRYNARNAKPRLKAPNRELLARLRQSCKNYDMIGIDRAMSELEETDYEEGGDLVVWLREKIDISEIGDAADRIAEYEEELDK